MKKVTLASLAAALLLSVGPAGANEVGIGTLIVGKWEMVSGPEGDPKWDVEFTRGGTVLVYAGRLTLEGKYKILDEKTIETEIRSIVDPKKVTFTKLGIKVNFEELTITDGNVESKYRRVKAPAPANPDAKVRERVKRLVEEMMQALVRGDYARVADLTLAKVVEESGGRDKIIAEMKAAMQGAKEKGLAFKVEGVEPPTDFARAGDKLFAVVPSKLEVTGLGVKLSQPGFVVGVSGDQGKTWTFIDGADLEGLRRFLPDLPKQLRLPQAPGLLEKDQ